MNAYVAWKPASIEHRISWQPDAGSILAAHRAGVERILKIRIGGTGAYGTGIQQLLGAPAPARAANDL